MIDAGVGSKNPTLKEARTVRARRNGLRAGLYRRRRRVDTAHVRVQRGHEPLQQTHEKNKRPAQGRMLAREHENALTGIIQRCSSTACEQIEGMEQERQAQPAGNMRGVAPGQCGSEREQDGRAR